MLAVDMTRSLACSIVLAWTSPVCAQAALVNTAERTFLFDDGQVIGARNGTFVATSHGLVELRIEYVDVPLDGCVPGDETDDELVGPPARAQGVGLRFVAVAEDGTTTMLYQDAPERGLRDYEAGIPTLRVLGPYVLAIAYQSYSGCMGNRPDSMGNMFVGHDLERGRR
jgi:hypothetical protein